MVKIETMFGGEGAECYNVFRTALREAAHMHGFSGEYAEYELLQLPRTSLTVAIVNTLHEMGYCIQESTDHKRQVTK